MNCSFDAGAIALSTVATARMKKAAHRVRTINSAARASCATSTLRGCVTAFLTVPAALTNYLLCAAPFPRDLAMIYSQTSTSISPPGLTRTTQLQSLNSAPSLSSSARTESVSSSTGLAILLETVVMGVMKAATAVSYLLHINK